ncbi:MAG: peptide deformylase [Candidatus Magasanikbacteria bacterium CG10_big_fil_rev_8_21_14_0_10_36_32]|uniref:Peptide deformylase n=1 Tax=Candidatus Magasanikbacteria bacterium CG10_big_fil_rev_8_21_14_0_10_36_32 TaxID=1974646 RepID=A0A2M6W7K7_9BACT|nr:MAG: peptide deformylase [Candidatus Magasanikbacteria bacterium CG10_big_fil_rev_8_21_14_0_10_36_32]
MILDIVTDPNEILHKKSASLSADRFGSPDIKKLTTNMIETMYAKDGVGLAAPQIGQSLAICVIAKKYTPNQKTDLILINPEWEKMSLQKTIDDEGCLSVPNIFGEVKRYKKIKVYGQNIRGEKMEFPAEDYFARILQHEIDHLNGILFIEKAKKLRQADLIQL